MKKDEAVAWRDFEQKSKLKIMATVGTIMILFNSIQNPISIVGAVLFLVSVNYAVPLTKRDNISIIMIGVCFGLLFPILIVWFFKM